MGSSTSATQVASEPDAPATAVDPLVASILAQSIYTDTQSILAHSFVADSVVSDDCHKRESVADDVLDATFLSTTAGGRSDLTDEGIMPDEGYDGDTDDMVFEDALGNPKVEPSSRDTGSPDMGSYTNDIARLLREDSFDGKLLCSPSHGFSPASEDVSYPYNPLTHDVSGTPLATITDTFISVASTGTHGTYRTALASLRDRMTSSHSGQVPLSSTHWSNCQGSQPRQRKRDRLKQMLRLRRRDSHGESQSRGGACNAAKALLRRFPCFADRQPDPEP